MDQIHNQAFQFEYLVGGSTSGTHTTQNWAGFNDMVIDTGSGTSRTYTVDVRRNAGGTAYFRNGYLFAMEMKPN